MDTVDKCASARPARWSGGPPPGNFWNLRLSESASGAF